MKLEFGMGNGVETVEVKEKNLMGILEANPVPEGVRGKEAVLDALAHPIGTRRLKELVRPGEKIAVITSDITRPMPTWEVLPFLLDELYAGGVKGEDITLVFALGSHRRHTPEEMEHLAGERAYKEIRCVDLDTENCVHIGVTSRGTPVDIDRRVAEADRRICLGNIEYHYFAGYSGGAKAIMPGVSTRDAIQANHCRMIEDAACAGRIEGNPVREDIEEAADMVGVDFILNVVLDPHKRILKAVAGDVTLAHRAGCAFLDQLYGKPLESATDIVIASQGGAPKDINLYQTQKALDNAAHAVKKGGVIILIGSCREGLGEKTFEKWMTTAPDPETMIRWIRQEFRLGGHKAAAIAMVLQKADIYLVSELPPEFVKRIFLQPFETAEQAYEAARKKCGEDAKVLAMPFAGSTLPKIIK